jgi:hypothetical protein
MLLSGLNEERIQTQNLLLDELYFEELYDSCYLALSRWYDADFTNLIFRSIWCGLENVITASKDDLELP